jgi:hypothetical protein
MRPRIQQAPCVDSLTHAQRVVQVLAQLYNVSFCEVRRLYCMYDGNVEQTKMILNLITK